MTKENFHVLCQQVLLPALSKLLHHQLAELHATLDVMSRELIRVGDRLDKLEASRR